MNEHTSNNEEIRKLSEEVKRGRSNFNSIRERNHKEIIQGYFANSNNTEIKGFIPSRKSTSSQKKNFIAQNTFSRSKQRQYQDLKSLSKPNAKQYSSRSKTKKEPWS